MSETAPAPLSPSRGWRWLRRLGWTLAVLATFVALVHAVENFRGARAWKHYQQDAAARGVRLDFASIVPPALPDAENGANTPFIQSWFLRANSDDTNRWNEINYQSTNQWPALFSQVSELLGVKRRTTGGGGADDRYLTDYTGWQEAFSSWREAGGKEGARKIKRTSHDPALDPKEQADAARAVLDELKMYGPVLDELRAASRHTRVRYPVTYNEKQPFAIVIPHLAKLKSTVALLKVRAGAHLAAGQTDAAFADVKLMFWLCDSMEHEPFLISHLVRIAGRAILMQPVWEGLARHQWNDAQLQELQGLFARADFAGALDRSLAAERAGSITTIEGMRNFRTRGEMMESLSDGMNDEGELSSVLRGGQRLLQQLVPSGWFQMEKVSIGKLLDQNILGGWDTRENLFHPSVIEEKNRAMEDLFKKGRLHSITHHHMYARLLLPALHTTSMRSARAQATASQAALACALERFYLAEKKYPAALTELVPKYLAKVPHEVVSSEPMRYRAENGGYVLWSAGWDGTDDGGIFLRAAKDGKPETGDWVWRSTP